jgi:hypothetical protein
MTGRAGLAVLSIAAGVMLLALGLAACGGGDGEGSSTAASTATTAQQGAQGSSGNGSKQKAKSTEKQGGGGGKSSGSGGGNSGNDQPIRHNDSGGGSTQYRVKGGDNSVQDFGDEADTSERDQAAEAVHGFLDARANRDWAKACTYLAAPVVEQLESAAEKSEQLKDKGCAAILEALSSQANRKLLREEAAQADVGSLRIEDERAFVIFRGLDKTVYTIPMVDEDGEWRLGSIAPTPLS